MCIYISRLYNSFCMSVKKKEENGEYLSIKTLPLNIKFFIVIIYLVYIKITRETDSHINKNE